MYIVSGIHKTYAQGYTIYNHMQFPDGSKAPGGDISCISVAGTRKMARGSNFSYFAVVGRSGDAYFLDLHEAWTSDVCNQRQ